MEKSFFNPTVSLKCSRCNIKTPHVLVDFSEEPRGGKEAIALNYARANAVKERRFSFSSRTSYLKASSTRHVSCILGRLGARHDGLDSIWGTSVSDTT
jgi:hypothetical protein